DQDFELAASLRDQEKQAKDNLEKVLQGWRDKREEKQVVITEEDIMHVVSKWCGVPLSRMEKSEAEKLLQTEAELKKSIIGQDEACAAIGKALRRSRADLKDPRRPIGSFVFLGPTGVGKSLLAKLLAEFMFGSQDALVQLDMSEYMEKFNVSRLIGSPPGYVGYEEGGQLSERIRRRPYSVVLFDEIEKAHPDVLNMLLQVLEDGKLTDNFGRKVDFRNTIIIMTSNVGSEALKKGTTMGFATAKEADTYEAMKEKLLSEAKRVFRPEFLNRLDDVIVFRALNKEDMAKIVDIEVGKVSERLKYKDVRIHLAPAAKSFLIEKGYDPALGARPLRRAVERYLEEPLAEELIRGSFKPNEVIEVSVAEGKLVFHQLAPQPS
ncbi:MAG: ATP-dependent Clp protease ATP-binding subunit, partial [Planctomycetes bacterium]|nr:ATP-dependent Clp protease ATP-binding subunit [Planctomycetota bacterium]